MERTDILHAIENGKYRNMILTTDFAIGFLGMESTPQLQLPTLLKSATDTQANVIFNFWLGLQAGNAHVRL